MAHVCPSTIISVVQMMVAIMFANVNYVKEALLNVFKSHCCKYHS